MQRRDADIDHGRDLFVPFFMSFDEGGKPDNAYLPSLK